jgi:pyruvate dehydrogenase E2 component (dihydrolipoamide acetyltransferase)
MATEVYMEALSPTMEEGQLVRWLKAEGDAVASGDLLAEIETDKATMELVARGDGVLRKILLGEGKTAPIGQVIAVIAAADEDISAKLPGGAAKVASEGTSDTAPAPAAAPRAAAPPADSPAAESAETSRAAPRCTPEQLLAGSRKILLHFRHARHPWRAATKLLPAFVACPPSLAGKKNPARGGV